MRLGDERLPARPKLVVGLLRTQSVPTCGHGIARAAHVTVAPQWPRLLGIATPEARRLGAVGAATHFV